MTTTKTPRLLTCPRCNSQVEKLRVGKGWHHIPEHNDPRTGWICHPAGQKKLKSSGGRQAKAPERLMWGTCGECGRESPMCAKVRWRGGVVCHLCSCCRLDNPGKWRVVRS